MERRGFLKTILALGMAPAIVKATSLMQIVQPHPKAMPDFLMGFDLASANGETTGLVVATRKKPLIKSWELGLGEWVPMQEISADAIDWLAENPHVHCRRLHGGSHLDVLSSCLASPEQMAETAAMRRRMGIPPPQPGTHGVQDAPFKIWCLTEA